MLRVVCLLIILSTFLSGCVMAPTTENSTPPDDVINSTPVETNLQDLSDEELIRRLVDSRALEAWGLQSTHVPTSALGYTYLFKLSEEYTELALRPNGLNSLKELGPAIIEETLLNKSTVGAIQGIMLADLIIYLFPEMEAELNLILEKYQ